MSSCSVFGRHKGLYGRMVLATVLAIVVTCSLPASAASNGFTAFADDVTAAFVKTKSKPWAVAPLLRLRAVASYLPEGAYLDHLESAKVSSGLHPWVRAVLDRLQLDALFQAKALAEATALASSMGFATSWCVSGPLEGSIDDPWAFDAAATPPPPSFVDDFAVELPPYNPTVYLDDLLWPSQGTSALLATVVTIPKQGEATLHVDSSSDARVWIDGALVLETKAAPLTSPEHAWAKVSLSAGDHLVEVSSTGSVEGRWGISLRITDLDVTVAKAPCDAVDALPRPMAPVSDAPLPATSTAFDLITGTAHPASLAADATLLMALYSLDVTPFEASLAPLDRALFGSTDDSCLDGALTASAKAPTSTAGSLGAFFSADLYAGKQRYLKALVTLEALPDDFGPAKEVLAMKILADCQIYAEPSVTLASLLDAPHPSGFLVETAAYVEMLRGNTTRALELYQDLASTRFASLNVHYIILNLMVSLGALETLVSYLDDLAPSFPTITSLAMEKATHLLTLGKPQDAMAALEPYEALKLPSLLEKRGALLYTSTGAPSAAEAVWQLALDVNPSNQDLRRRLLYLFPERTPFEIPYKVAPADVVDGPVEETTELYRLKVVKLHPRGKSTSFVQRIIQIGDTEGEAGLDKIYVEYNSTTQRLDLETVTVLHPDGSTSSVTDYYDMSLSNEDVRIYYDWRALAVPLEDLSPGDVVVVEYRITDYGLPFMEQAFGEVFYFRGALPITTSRYVLVHGDEVTITHEAFAPPGLPTLPAIEESIVDGQTVLDVSIGPLPGIVEEAHMPSLAELSPYIHISSFATWPAVVDWYEALVAPQVQVTDALEARVAELTESTTDELGGLMAIYRFVANDIRYVGLEFGIHNYKPYPSSKVLQRRFGDCKDKSVLLVAMLSLIGVEANLVLVRLDKNGPIATSPPSLVIFDHVIVHVPKYDLWLDATIDSMPAGFLAAFEHGALALEITPDSAGPITLPALTSDATVQAETFALSLAPDAPPGITGTLTATGELAKKYKSAIAGQGDPTKKTESLLVALFPGLGVGSVSVEGADDADASAVAVTFAGTWPTLCKGTSSSSVCPLGLSFFDIPEDRVNPVVFSYPYQHVVELTIEHPGGSASIPPVAPITSPFGSLTLSAIDTSPGTTSLTVTYEQTATKVSVEDFPAYRSFITECEELLDTLMSISWEASP